jgi:cholesterol transport system auxiliary component
MPRSTRRFGFSGAALALLLAPRVLSGCAGTPSALSDIRYDLGPATPPATNGTMPAAVKVLDVTAPDPLNSDRLNYRLNYADGQQVASYANSHWTMPPSQLLTQRLRTALSTRGTVLTGADGVRAPVSSSDAAGGARALAAASDDLVAQVAAWLGVQALVAAQ